MELYALKLLPITPTRTPRYAANLMPKNDMPRKVDSLPTDYPAVTVTCVFAASQLHPCQNG